MRDRQWLAEADNQAEGRTYLVLIERDGQAHGWQYGTLSGVLDCLSEAAYASFIDEEPDTYRVFALTDHGPVPCVVESKRHDPIGKVEHRVSFRDPMTRGRKVMISETGYTDIYGA